jgi:hypothetical protein
VQHVQLRLQVENYTTSRGNVKLPDGVALPKYVIQVVNSPHPHVEGGEQEILPFTGQGSVFLYFPPHKSWGGKSIKVKNHLVHAPSETLSPSFPAITRHRQGNEPAGKLKCAGHFALSSTQHEVPEAVQKGRQPSLGPRMVDEIGPDDMWLAEEK